MSLNHECYIGLGSNLGDREQHIMQAIQAIHQIEQTEVFQCSAVYETDPVGYTDQPAFLNMAVAVQTALPLDRFFNMMLQIEAELGRVRAIRWGPRVIDLDLLLFDDLVMQSENLDLPHPRMFERAFVLVPLLDVLREGNHWFVSANQALEKMGSKEGIKLWKRINWHNALGHFES